MSVCVCVLAWYTFTSVRNYVFGCGLMCPDVFTYVLSGYGCVSMCTMDVFGVMSIDVYGFVRMCAFGYALRCLEMHGNV